MSGPVDPAAGGVMLVWPGAPGVMPGAAGGGAPGTTGGTLWRRAPQAAGSVPFTKAIGTTRTHSF
ncbi:MAG TPA: efflux RND transporter periplasmic adaptor subunit, partial [Methylomirabilota bacterium]|nr:efflux RND transporter periplasmic adaptor subunit [Methylomirabilota bacterium]